MLYFCVVIWIGIVQHQGTSSYLPFLQKLLLVAIAAAVPVLLSVLLLDRTVTTLLSRPLRNLTSILRTSDSHRPVALGRVGVEEIDDLSCAIEDLSLRVSESSSILSRVIDLSDISIAAFELDKVSGKVICTGQFFSMLSVNGKSVDQQATSIDDFRNVMDNAGLVIDQTLDKGWVVCTSSDKGTRWIKITLMDEENRMLGVLVDVTEDTLSKRHIEYERDYDLLTNLLNRRAFMVAMRKLFETPETLGVSALLLLDLDNLKYINDSYGHDCGDGYLRAAANAMKTLPLQNMLLARMSGDEFFLFLYGQESKEQIRALLGDLKQIISESYYILPGGDSIRVRCSAGVTWYPDDALLLDDLTRYADFAMYTAKNYTKGEFCEFNRAEYDKNSFLLHSREELNKLIEHRLLDYHFQPIVSALSGDVFAYEALMRSRLSTLSSPLEVLALARAQSKLYDIEKLTWFAAMEAATSDPIFLNSDRRIFINSVSNRILNDDDIEELRSTFQRYLHRMVLEVTEEEKFNEDVTRKKQMLLYKWGGAVALDDFGTGYNGEMVLLQLVPDYVKIDMSIVRNIDVDPSRQELFRNLVSYSHERNIMVIAEGVETASEMNTLIRLGADYLQGYYLGKPAAAMRTLPEALVLEIQTIAHDVGRTFTRPGQHRVPAEI